MSKFDKRLHNLGTWGNCGYHKVTQTKFDLNGYDFYGRDIHGYDKYGYDKYGYDFFGFDKDRIYMHTKTPYKNNGYDFFGFDKDGIHWSIGTKLETHWDKDGYTKSGYDRKRHHKDGYDKDGYDVHGVDRNHFNEYGYTLMASSEGWFWKGPIGWNTYLSFMSDPNASNIVDKRGFKKHGSHAGAHIGTGSKYNFFGFDKDGFSKQDKKFDKDGICKDTGTNRDKDGYDNHGFDSKGFHMITGTMYNLSAQDKSGQFKSNFKFRKTVGIEIDPKDFDRKFDPAKDSQFFYTEHGYDDEGNPIVYDNYQQGHVGGGAWNPHNPPHMWDDSRNRMDNEHPDYG